ncbi:hypothetical protein LWI29_028490 [Acer saccharum]|uniref:Uncharacterized protein n=1 Tax=Acer saccharum TaxID=4024 RepID=A0AA39W0N0_ACESA|nr:hypothetical protein LWI29_028490 [Acer saccharum]
MVTVEEEEQWRGVGGVGSIGKDSKEDEDHIEKFVFIGSITYQNLFTGTPMGMPSELVVELFERNNFDAFLKCCSPLASGKFPGSGKGEGKCVDGFSCVVFQPVAVKREMDEIPPLILLVLFGFVVFNEETPLEINPGNRVERTLVPAASLI